MPERNREVMDGTAGQQNTVLERVKRCAGRGVRFLRCVYRTLMSVLTVLLALVFLVAAFSDHVAPQTNLYVSYLGVAFPFLLLLAVLWAVLLFLLRLRWLSVCMMLVLAVAYEPAFRFVPFHFGSRSPLAGETETPRPVEELKILTYNTCRMGQTRLSDLSTEVPVLDVIRNSGADIVCLQEYGFSLSRNGYTESHIRYSLSDIYPYYHYLPYHGVEATGIALYSRYPIREARRVDDAKEYFASMCYLLDVGGREMALINNHLHSNKIKVADREFYDNMVGHFESDSLARVHYNLIRQLGRGCLARAGQSEKIARVRRSLGDSIPIIICGDMNDTPVSYCYHTVRGDLADTWAEGGFGPGITFHRHKFWFRIDHFFHSRHFYPLDVRVLDEYDYSDHYPLLATYQLLTP